MTTTGTPNISISFRPSDEQRLEEIVLPWIDDSTGKEHLYRYRIYKVDEQGEKEQLCLTKHEWTVVFGNQMKETLQKVQEVAPEFLPGKVNRFNFDIGRDIQFQYSIGEKEFPKKTLNGYDPKIFFNSIISLKPMTTSSWKAASTASSASQREALSPSVPATLPSGGIEKLTTVRSKPLGIKNEGNDCFIIAYLHFLFFNDPKFIKAILEDTNEDLRELREFIRKYQMAESGPVEGVHAIRNTLCKMMKRAEYNSSQHDPTEAFGFAHDEKIMRTDHTQTQTIKYSWKNPGQFGNSKDFLAHFTTNDIEGATLDSDTVCTTNTMSSNGCFPLSYQSEESIAQMINAAFAPTLTRQVGEVNIQGEGVISWERPPEHFIFTVQNMHGTLDQPEKLPVTDVPESISPPGLVAHTYHLTSFIQHRGQTGRQGHYVAYIKCSGKYYECNDAAIKKIEKKEFIDAANSKDPSCTSYCLKYTRST